MALHFDEYLRNNLGSRNFHQIGRTPADRELVSRVRQVPNMIASMHNLLIRGEGLERGAVIDSESVVLLREETFPTRWNTLSLLDGK